MQNERDVLVALDEYAAAETKAFAMYSRQYERQYPQPVRLHLRWYTGIPWIAALFAIIAVAGSALAAFRTAPVFIEVAEETVSETAALIEGFLAMLVVDLGVIAFRYASIYLMHKNKDYAPQITDWVKRGAEFAFATQLIAQLYAVRGMVTWLPGGIEGFLQLAIAVAAALSGMVLAFVTGEILAVLALQMQHDRRVLLNEYHEHLNEWREALTKAWKADRNRYIGTPPAADRKRHSRRVSRLSDSADKRADKPLSPSEKTALHFLVSNPDAADLTVREVADLSGVNRDAVSKAMRRYRMEMSGNGHGEVAH